LGYAPGSWSQVAVNRTQPEGKVVGIDIIPAQPPRGVSTLQGDFLSPAIREELVKFVREGGKKAKRSGKGLLALESGNEDAASEDDSIHEQGSIVESMKRKDSVIDSFGNLEISTSSKDMDVEEGRVVDVVLSDMSEPWPLTASSWIRSVSNPYYRMMNTSGMAFRDHAGSMVCRRPILRDVSFADFCRIYAMRR
jgi:21S rRNA (uridine2791-2'-O)-methyltransferase